jgi:hypothetical protein
VKLADLDYKNTELVGARDSFFGSQAVDAGLRRREMPDSPALNREAKWDATLNISSLPKDTGIKFFYPFTTTLIELQLNREPLPLTGKNEVCWF